MSSFKAEHLTQTCNYIVFQQRFPKATETLVYNFPLTTPGVIIFAGNGIKCLFQIHIDHNMMSMVLAAVDPSLIYKNGIHFAQ